MSDESPLGTKRYPHMRGGGSWKGLCVGLLGGSFNPPHHGHLAISVFAMKTLGLDRVWWLVSPQNPTKSAQEMAPMDMRLSAARHILREQPRMLATDIEREMATVYTVDTLRQLKRRYPHTCFVWLMGADNMRQIPRWQGWTDIFRLVPVAVLRRPGYVVGHNLGKAAQRYASSSLPARSGRLLATASPPCWTVLDNPLNPQSSTEIRRRCHHSTWQQDCFDDRITGNTTKY